MTLSLVRVSMCSRKILLFDSEFPRLSIPPHSLVDSSICTAADEANDLVTFMNPYFADVATGRHLLRVRRFYCKHSEVIRQEIR